MIPLTKTSWYHFIEMPVLKYLYQQHLLTDKYMLGKMLEWSKYLRSV